MIKEAVNRERRSLSDIEVAEHTIGRMIAGHSEHMRSKMLEAFTLGMQRERSMQRERNVLLEVLERCRQMAEGTHPALAMDLKQMLERHH